MLVGQEKKETGKERGQGRLRQRRNNNPQDLKTDGLKASKFSPCQVHSANSGLKKKTTSSFGKFRKKNVISGLSVFSLQSGIESS